MEKGALWVNHAICQPLTNKPSCGPLITGEGPGPGLWVTILVPLLPICMTLEK